MTITKAILVADINSWMGSGTVKNVDSTLRVVDAIIARSIRIPAMIKVAGNTTSPLVVSNRNVTLPEDFIELISFFSGDTKLEYVSVSDIVDGLDADQYTQFARDLELGEGTDTTDLILVYYSRFSALVDDDDTNWLLQNAYDVYLNLALSAASSFALDFDQAKQFGDRATASVDMLIKSMKRSRIATALQRRSTTSASRDAP